MQKMSSHGRSTPWHIASLTTKVLFQKAQKAFYELQGPFAYLKHHLSNFVQVALLDDQYAETDIPLPFDNLKHRIIDFTKVVLKTSTRQIMSSQEYSPTYIT
jgi:hypothetical protein